MLLSYHSLAVGIVSLFPLRSSTFELHISVSALASQLFGPGAVLTTDHFLFAADRISLSQKKPSKRRPGARRRSAEWKKTNSASPVHLNLSSTDFKDFNRCMPPSPHSMAATPPLLPPATRRVRAPGPLFSTPNSSIPHLFEGTTILPPHYYPWTVWSTPSHNSLW